MLAWPRPVYAVGVGLISTVLAIALGWIASLQAVGVLLTADFGLTGLVVLGILSVIGLRSQHVPFLGRLDPATQLASALLSFAFAGGVLFAGTALGSRAHEISTLFLITVAAFVAGSSLTRRVWLPRDLEFSFDFSFDYLRHPAIVAVLLCVFFAAILTFATGEIPLLASSINSARFGAGGGALHQLWGWLIGAIEWLAIAASVRCVAARRLERRGLMLTSIALGMLLLLAGRSFLFLVAFAILLAFLTLRRVRLTWLITAGVLLLLALGGFASYRAQHSTTYGEGGKSSSITHLLQRSVGIGPAVFASTLEEIPTYVPFQYGAFAFRDLRADLPKHPLGRTETSDYWVTTVVRHRLTAYIGGSPPTLTGGLYIDFGVPGILAGALLLGTLLSLLYMFAARSRSLSVLVLYTYFGAYIVQSAYSYVSFKPEVVMVVVLSAVAYYLEQRATRSCRKSGDLHSRMLCEG